MHDINVENSDHSIDFPHSAIELHYTKHDRIIHYIVHKKNQNITSNIIQHYTIPPGTEPLSLTNNNSRYTKCRLKKK